MTQNEYGCLTSDMNVRPELLGITTLLAPFAQFTSSQRLVMFSNNLPQALVVNGCEPPRIMTGWEPIFAKYEFDKTVRDQNVEIISVIPKFQVGRGPMQVQSSPSFTVIYRGEEDNKIGYFEVSSYTKLHNGFGYMNKRLNHNNLMEHTYVPKDMKFTTAPNHDGNFYCQGFNANVAFLSAWETTEDAFVVSRSLQKKAEHKAIKTLDLMIPINNVPLNLYGTGDEYKCFPDIGELVRDDGIIVGFRERNEISVLSDMTANALMTPEFLHDELHHAPPGAEIIDVQVFVKPEQFKKLRNVDGTYSQLMKYAEQHNEYYNSIIKTYERIKHDGYSLRPEMNNLVTRCLGLAVNKTSPRIKLRSKKEEVEFMHLSITYCYTRKLSRGSKLTGRDGAKGVVSDIWEDAYMPVDKQGFRADILITPASVFNRMNPAQFYEQFFNRASICVQRKVAEMVKSKVWNMQEAYNYIIGYLTDVRTNYGKFVDQRMRSKYEEFVDQVITDGIYLVIPPFCKDIGPDKVRYIADKYGIEESPVTYIRTMPDGTKKTVTTTTEVCVGPKYLFLLGKIPLDQLNCVEIGYVSHFNTPAKSNSKYIKSQNPFGTTPIRLGEDETCNLVQAFGVEPVARLIGLYANSPVGVDMLEKTLLTAEQPSNIDRVNISTQDVINTNNNVAIFHHQMAAIGYSLNPEDCGDKYRVDRFPSSSELFPNLVSEYTDDEEEEDAGMVSCDTESDEQDDDNVPSMRQLADDAEIKDAPDDEELIEAMEGDIDDETEDD